MAEETGQVAIVKDHVGDEVLIGAPLHGARPGFRLKPGDKVLLVRGEEGPVVRPIVQAIVVDASPEEAVAALRDRGLNFEVQEATVTEDTGAGQTVVWIVERVDDEPGEVIAVRREEP